MTEQEMVRAIAELRKEVGELRRVVAETGRATGTRPAKRLRADMVRAA